MKNVIGVLVVVIATVTAPSIGRAGVEAEIEAGVVFVGRNDTRIPGKGGILFDADALAAPQGRAEDILLAATWSFHDTLELRVGYRMIEGGADNDEVYSFAWLHYLVAGLGMTF